MALLDAAYEAGIRHFDMAPMYGLGRAEAEFGAWAKDKGGDLTVATKFGIDPSAVGRLAGSVQGPVRKVLAARPKMGEELKTAGAGPTSGGIGRLLYTSTGYTPEAAARSLDRSLRILGRQHVDLLFLHDPVGVVRPGASELVDYLDAERRRGRIGAWGVAGERFETDPHAQFLLGAAPVLQFRDDALEAPSRLGDDPRVGKITFGAFGRVFELLRNCIKLRPEVTAKWEAQLDLDLSSPEAISGMLIREALRRNKGGTVLFTSTKVRHIRAAASAADDPIRMEAPETDAVAEFLSIDPGRHPGLGSGT
jgi:D-threo-aldose 1-dehydrogenase